MSPRLPEPSSPIAPHIVAFVRHKRALNRRYNVEDMRFESAEVLLRRFCRVMGNPEISEIAPERVAAFLQGSGSLSASWTLRYRVLGGFYRFAVSRDYAAFSPLPTNLPNLPPQQTPYVYSTEELRRLLDATSILKLGHSPQVPAMYRTLLLLLYRPHCDKRCAFALG